MKRANLISRIDNVIMLAWKNNITKDYSQGRLLYEGSLKCALYTHIRKALRDRWLDKYSLAIYSEAYIGKKKADIVIVIAKKGGDNSHLKNNIQDYLAIIECKYRTSKASLGTFQKDIYKLGAYQRDYPAAKLYACFVRDPFDKEPEVMVIKKNKITQLWYGDLNNVKK